MQSTDTLVKLVIWHKDYNPDKKNNLDDVPIGKAVFGIFGIVNEEPINCRFVGETENLHKSIKGLFETPEGEGLKKFMQGPWIQILQYEIMEGSSQEERKKAVEAWTEKYKPGIDNEGEYPGYYDNWKKWPVKHAFHRFTFPEADRDFSNTLYHRRIFLSTQYFHR